MISCGGREEEASPVHHKEPMGQVAPGLGFGVCQEDQIAWCRVLCQVRHGNGKLVLTSPWELSAW